MDLTWIKDAACKGMTDAFFPVDATRPSLALATCKTCTVRNPCRTYALINNEQHGVWGGIQSDELKRRRIKCCGYCGTSFEGMHGNARYCSSECSERSALERRWGKVNA